ncbi:reverse transcriptase domain-containing protein, partial [Tanacetum coccineum]
MITTNNHNKNKTIGRTLAEPTLQDLVRRSHTKNLNPNRLNATITMMVHVLPNATSATELAIWPVTVGVPPMPTLLTTKGELGQVRNLLAMNVEPRDISRGIVQSLKTTTAVTKLEMAIPAKVYAIGRVGTNPDSNVVTGKFFLNKRYASVLFDTGADRSFVSTAFSSQIDITPTALDHYYDVELADGRII